MKTDSELIEDFYVSQGGKPTATKADIEFYSSSWDMLMPVVEKILYLYGKGNQSKDWNLNVHVLKGPLLYARKEVVYTAVVEFIKWYNEQPKG